jgi:hypothetical protein
LTCPLQTADRSPRRGWSAGEGDNRPHRRCRRVSRADCRSSSGFRFPRSGRSLKTEERTKKASAGDHRVRLAVWPPLSGGWTGSCSDRCSTQDEQPTSVGCPSDQFARTGCEPVTSLTALHRLSKINSLFVGCPVRRPSVVQVRDFDGEFDPGSGRTLAACLTHASRAGSIRWQHRGRSSGERVSNT